MIYACIWWMYIERGRWKLTARAKARETKALLMTMAKEICREAIVTAKSIPARRAYEEEICGRDDYVVNKRWRVPKWGSGAASCCGDIVR